MFRHEYFVACVAAIWHVLFSVAHLAQVLPMNLKAGVAFVDITPPIPFRMSGYFYERLSTGIKDPLHAQAIVFQQGKEIGRACVLRSGRRAAGRRDCPRARKPARRPAFRSITSRSPARIRTRGPLVFCSLHDYLARAGRRSKLGKDPYDSDAVPAELIDKIAEAVVEAKAALAPVELKSGYADEDASAFNRRYSHEGRLGALQPADHEPGYHRPAGPIDPQVGIILFRSPAQSEPRRRSFRLRCILTRRAARCTRPTMSSRSTID